LGRLLIVVGSAALAAGTFSGAVAYTSLRNGRAAHGWLVVEIALTAMAILLAAGRSAIRHGNRERAPVMPGLIDIPEGQKIVLFLRSFADDDGFAHVIAGPARGPWATTSLTEEQQLARATRQFGTLVALGRPSDTLPQAGAIRTYTPDDEWQAHVLAALERTNLILLACGPGSNLRWEVGQVIARGLPERSVLVIARDAKQYESFRAELQELFPKGLPSWSDGSAAIVSGPDGAYTLGAIWFEADWTPHLVCLGSWDDGIRGYRLIKRHRWVESTFPLAIRPVYQRADLSPPGLPATPRTRPWPVNLSVALLALSWGLPWVKDAIDYKGPRGDLWTFAFAALLGVILLYRTWRGGFIAVIVARFFAIILAATSFALALLLARTSAQFILTLLMGGSLAIGGLLLVRQDSREWVASRALKSHHTQTRP
jgi:hypothetical protein